MEEHQREEPDRLRLVGHQLGEHARQADRLGAQLAPDERLAGRRAVALVEDQVEHAQHGLEPLRAGPRAAGRGTGCRRRGSSASPGRGAGRASTSGTRKARAISGVRQAAQRAQRERDPRLRRERRVAAREDEAEPVVDGVRLCAPLLRPGRRPPARSRRRGGSSSVFSARRAPAPDPVDRRGCGRSS